MEDDQQFCLRWNNHQNTLISNFDKLLENGTLVDCTLAAEGQFLKAHKVVLSACSPYFANLLKEQYDKHPIFILKDVKYQELRAMMDYMYRGEVNISQDQLAALLKAAESLQIKGLSDRPQRSTDQHPNINVPGRMQHPHGGGYTLEQTKRPRLGPVIDTPDMREGSSSPTSRKRKKLRRRSIENVMDNHEHSNSSAHSTQPINTSTPSITSGTAAIVATSQQQQQQSQQSLQQSSVSQQQQQQGNIVGTKKTENVSNIKQTAGSSDDVLLAEQDNQMEQEKQIKKDQNKQQRKSGHDKDELLIEPKNEYEEVNEPIEDLTEDPEELMDEEDLDNQAGPSHHGGEGSSQGFPQWPADRSQDEFIMTAQDQGQQRDPQGSKDTKNPARIRVRNWLMLADKNMVASIQNLKSDSIVNETNISKISKIETNITNTTSDLVNITNNNNNNTVKNNNNNTNSENEINNKNNNVDNIALPKLIPNSTILTNNDEEIAVTNDSNETDIVIKIERNSPSPAASLLLNNLSDFSCDFDEDDEESGSEEFDGSTPSEFNYDIKLSSPVSWAFQPVKIENLDEDYDNIPIINQPIHLPTTIQTQDQNSQTIISSAVTNGGLASAVAAIANQSIASIKKSTTTLVPIKQNSQQSKINTSEQLLKIFSSAALTTATTKLSNSNNDLPILAGNTSSTLVTILPTLPNTTIAKKDSITNQIIPKGTSIRLVQQLDSPSVTPIINNNLLSSSSTTTVSSTNNNTNVVSTTSSIIAPASITGPDDKKYRILYQNQRIRKESLEHSPDMIYKGVEVEKPWICKNCNRDYKWKNSLKCHLKNECGQPPRYFCKKMCGYRTNVHSNLKRHMNTKCKDDDKEGCTKKDQPVHINEKDLVTNTV
ncbi:longitudinals lacking protein, isoforms J/P/Q/S/Z isoform X1 [Condylostylus longicornis]|uniref:longitudinals lacking protein, isoforms J/P/Q/S/Z isoform X1 n=1 Tax=Condylostylus longicornis TaxID=2530218 RepID=UPI00244DB024|nr:longitudinals lacking protein, isoforms J/P/Q/S/Z isoform X1 [Condylostylus longicornis]